MKITDEYIRKLIARAESLNIKIGSPSQHIDKEMYLSGILEEANSLIGYILALNDIE